MIPAVSYQTRVFEIWPVKIGTGCGGCAFERYPKGCAKACEVARCSERVKGTFKGNTHFPEHYQWDTEFIWKQEPRRHDLSSAERLMGANYSAPMRAAATVARSTRPRS